MPVHALERLQLTAIDLEKQIKANYDKAFARQLIAGAKEAVDYSYQKERDQMWFVKYIEELESRL
jgi:hypothetical protein